MKVKDELAYDLQIIQLGWMLVIFDITELVLLTFSTNTNTMIIPITQLLLFKRENTGILGTRGVYFLQYTGF